jgi:hypothetical protein
MIFGTHLLLYSRDPEVDRTFFRDVLGFAHVDAGGGWLIFALPPAEMGVHPAEGDLPQGDAGHEPAMVTLHLMCDNLGKTLDELASKGVDHAELREAEWGVATSICLPGGARLGLYEPRHALAVKATASGSGI